MKYQKLYYIHNLRDNFEKKDIELISNEFEKLDFTKSKEAAIGQGAGGSGSETIIEILVVVSSIAGLVDIIWRVSKFLLLRKPKNKMEIEKQVYNLIVHNNNNSIININLDTDAKTLKKLIKTELKKELQLNEDKYSKFYTSGDKWEKL